MNKRGLIALLMLLCAPFVSPMATAQSVGELSKLYSDAEAAQGGATTDMLPDWVTSSLGEGRFVVASDPGVDSQKGARQVVARAWMLSQIATAASIEGFSQVQSSDESGLFMLDGYEKIIVGDAAPISLVADRHYTSPYGELFVEFRISEADSAGFTFEPSTEASIEINHFLKSSNEGGVELYKEDVIAKLIHPTFDADYLIYKIDSSSDKGGSDEFEYQSSNTPDYASAGNFFQYANSNYPYIAASNPQGGYWAAFMRSLIGGIDSYVNANIAIAFESYSTMTDEGSNSTSKGSYEEQFRCDVKQVFIVEGKVWVDSCVELLSE